jgi:hypothetical protein
LKEEFGSLSAILRRNYNYLMSDPKRIIKLGIYLLYLYLFGRRFILTMKYFKSLLKKLFIVVSLNSLIGHAKGQSGFGAQKAMETLTAQTSHMKSIVQKLLRLLQFVYNLFIST